MEQETPIIVETQGLSKVFRLSQRKKIDALRDVTLKVLRKEYVVIRGPSGSGKTTLLSLLGCLDRPSAGRIYWNGRDLTIVSEEELCRMRGENIGFVFQGFNLLPRMTAWENVSISLVPLGVRQRERYLRASALLEQLGLQERIHHTPEELSGGEQQRVSMARALINEPDLILADEPTSNIDRDSAEKVMGLLSHLRNKGSTLVIATHDENLFQEADAVYYLRDGKVLGKEEKNNS
jgi:putative ABC transport system ATP-binding protein